MLAGYEFEGETRGGGPGIQALGFHQHTLSNSKTGFFREKFISKYAKKALKS